MSDKVVKYINDGKNSLSGECVILCVDTSGDDCQAGVVKCGDSGVDVLAEVSVRNRRAHSEKLIGLIDHVIQQAEFSKERLNAVAVSIGPGSFTGLRIGLAVAKGLGMGLGIPVIPVPTHDAYARPFRIFGRPVLVLTVYKKNEWFVTKYDAGEKSGTISMTAPQWLGLLEPSVIVVSDDAGQVTEQIPDDRRVSLVIPDTPVRGPRIAELGGLACEWRSRWDRFNFDELEPEYIQPFLGKM